MKEYFNKPIGSKEQVEDFLNKLHSDDLLFHPEDNPKDIIIKDADGKFVELFNKEECKLLDQRLKEVWEHYDDPCEYIMDNIYQKK